MTLSAQLLSVSNKCDRATAELAAERARVRQLQADLAHSTSAREAALQSEAQARSQLAACTKALEHQRQQTAQQAARAEAMSHELASREFGTGFGDTEFLHHKVSHAAPTSGVRAGLALIVVGGDVLRNAAA